MLKLLSAALLAMIMNPAWGAVIMIGDNDGYGAGIADNADHPPFRPIYDGRDAAEKLATNGAQYTDTYSTAHPGYGPQPGTITTFSFTGLGNGWTQGSMWFDMADFQASTFGAVITTYNGIVQNWAFNDGYPKTVVRHFDLAQNVLDSINLLGTLDVVIDRNGSGDFYGFDYALLSNRSGDDTDPNNDPTIGVPAPAALGLLVVGVAGLVLRRRRRA
ncbi:PEP-CTERM sorting domain-containing protein [Psychromonas aquimarina]|uniref:PEP-CTERM sorting domain-containing protein n=1 Tax=Psychromonas aquimarina TaxID=444919 RepID=UPI0003FEB99D|nr:PEP-CTERM sorting domain-containing protein [Psychromonas aquimarina]